MNEMGTLLGFLSAIVTMVTTLVLTQVLKNASASNNSNNTPSTSEPSDSSQESEVNPTPTPAPLVTAETPNPLPAPNPASPSTVPPAVSSSPPAASPLPTPPPAGNENVKTESVNGGGPNELVLKNTDPKNEMTIALFENTGPGMNPNIDDPNHKYILKPGETIKLSMPASWQGRAQKLSGNANDPASWAEINYEPGKDGGSRKIWYDLSLIRGYNSAVTMKPTNSNNGGDVAGTEKSIIDGAPADAVTTDAGGNKVIKDTEDYDGSIHQAAVDYFNAAVGNTIAYVRFNDDKAVRTTQDNSLTVTFGAA